MWDLGILFDSSYVVGKNMERGVGDSSRLSSNTRRSVQFGRCQRVLKKEKYPESVCRVAPLANSEAGRRYSIIGKSGMGKHVGVIGTSPAPWQAETE